MKYREIFSFSCNLGEQRAHTYIYVVKLKFTSDYKIYNSHKTAILSASFLESFFEFK